LEQAVKGWPCIGSHRHADPEVAQRSRCKTQLLAPQNVRGAVTDGTAQYRILDLLPGTYSVTFTLTGFNMFKRDGFELPL